MAPAAAAVVVAVVKSSDLVARRIARQAYERPWLQKPASKLNFLLSWSLDRVCVCRSLLPCCIFVISCHIAVVVGGYCRRSLLLFEFSCKSTVAVAHTSTNAFPIVSL